MLQSFSKEQRKALMDLCEILHLTMYNENDRKAIERMKELIRKNTLSDRNKCTFDMTLIDKAKVQFNNRFKK